jgi:DsbC/DsbD-like thiol-disulfide interchange protein
MHRIIQSLYLCVIGLLFSNTLYAQELKDPTIWTYEVKKMGNNEYQLIFNLKLDKGFHIWALNPGGDGFQVVPSFTFEDNKSVKLIGGIREQGKMITETMEGIEGEVIFFSDVVHYVQTVTANAGTIIKGTHEYQVCNDMMCLPPTDKEFTFSLK